jgi:hypothetical protein
MSEANYYFYSDEASYYNVSYSFYSYEAITSYYDSGG